VSALKKVNMAMHALAKRNLRAHAMAAMRAAIAEDLTLEAYLDGAARLAGVALPGAAR